MHLHPSQQTSWVEEQLRELDEDVERAPPPVFSLSFLWLDKNIAVAADQVLGNTVRGAGFVCLGWVFIGNRHTTS